MAIRLDLRMNCSYRFSILLTCLLMHMIVLISSPTQARLISSSVLQLTQYNDREQLHAAEILQLSSQLDLNDGDKMDQGETDKLYSKSQQLQYSHQRKPMALVPSPPLILDYHNGSILSGPDPIQVYLLFYGSFTEPQKQIVRNFVYSINTPPATHSTHSKRTVSNWWKLTSNYTDRSGAGVSQTVMLSGETADEAASMGTNSLTKDDILKIVLKNQETYPPDTNSIYLVLTAANIGVSGFCQDVCGQHLYTQFSSAQSSTLQQNQNFVYGWVGNSASQCPGFCAWPFAKPQYGPDVPPLLPPNGDVGMDGLIITLAKILAGAATDPFGTGYYQGDPSNSLEAGGACTGAFGDGWYQGYPGKLKKSNKTGGSFNVCGAYGTEFLVPWIWDPNTLACAGQA